MEPFRRNPCGESHQADRRGILIDALWRTEYGDDVEYQYAVIPKQHGTVILHKYFLGPFNRCAGGLDPRVEFQATLRSSQLSAQAISSLTLPMVGQNARQAYPNSPVEGKKIVCCIHGDAAGASHKICG